MTTSASNLPRLLAKLGACDDARQWAASQPDLETAWANCHRPDWMVWLLRNLHYENDRAYRLFARWCARSTPLKDGRTTWDLLKDDRSKRAVEVAERFANGEATRAELDEARRAAADAAYSAADADAAAAAAAYSAAYATYAAAYSAAADAYAAAAYAADAAAAAAYSAAAAAADAAAAAAAARKAQADQLRVAFPYSSWSHRVPSTPAVTRDAKGRFIRSAK